MVKNILLILIFTISCNNVTDASHDYILLPKKIVKFEKTGFDCCGRSWYNPAILAPTLSNELLTLNYSGYNDDSEYIFTAPGENNEEPILLKTRKKLVVELGKRINKEVIFTIQIINESFEKKTFTVKATGKKVISIPITGIGKEINHLDITFGGEKCIIKIKSIYIE